MSTDAGAGDYRVFASLQPALDAFRAPSENHALTRRFCDYVGIARFEERGSYIKAIRSHGGPALEIHFGWTNGFLSELEVRAAVGNDASYWPSQRGTDQWGVAHLVNKLHDSGGSSYELASRYGTCPIHHIELPASGICDDCS